MSIHPSMDINPRRPVSTRRLPCWGFLLPGLHDLRRACFVGVSSEWGMSWVLSHGDPWMEGDQHESIMRFPRGLGDLHHIDKLDCLLSF